MIKKLINSDLVSVFSGTSIQEVARIMDDKCVGMVVITEPYSEGKPVGIVTDRDIVINTVKENKDPSFEKIESIMSQSLVTATETTSIEEAIQTMESKQIRRLLVVDDAGKAKGVVSMDDIIILLGSEIHRLGKLCRNQIGTPKRHQSHDYTRMA